MFWRQFLPFVMLLLVIGLSVSAFISVSRLTLSLSASNPPSLRIWLEPDSLITSTNQALTLTVKANYESTSPLAFLSLRLKTPPQLQLTNPLVSASQPFRGTITLGQVTLTPTQPGDFTVTIPQSDIVTSVAPDHIHTATSQIIVKP